MFIKVSKAYQFVSVTLIAPGVTHIGCPLRRLRTSDYGLHRQMCNYTMVPNLDGLLAKNDERNRPCYKNENASFNQ